MTDDVLEALDHLPDDYRTTVLLADMLEYSYKDITRAMDCPMGTVMSRLHRGEQMLQTRLRQYALDQGLLYLDTRGWHVDGAWQHYGRITAGTGLCVTPPTGSPSQQPRSHGAFWRCNTSPVRGLMISSKQLPLASWTRRLIKRFRSQR